MKNKSFYLSKQPLALCARPCRREGGRDEIGGGGEMGHQEGVVRKGHDVIMQSKSGSYFDLQ